MDIYRRSKFASLSNWISVNAGQYNELARFQKGRIFKIPAGQFYH